MIEVSTRHAIGLLVLLLVAAVPVACHQLPDSRVDDCANPAEMFSADRIAATSGVQERGNKHRDGVFQWTEGQFRRVRPLQRIPAFRIIRAFEYVEFFFEPKRFFIGYPAADKETQLRHLKVGDREHAYYTRIDRREVDLSVATYMYIHRGEPTASVLGSLFSSGVEQLFGGTRPVTLLMIDAESALPNEDALLAWSEQSLASVWDFYRSVCHLEPAA